MIMMKRTTIKRMTEIMRTMAMDKNENDALDENNDNNDNDVNDENYEHD